MTSPFQEHTDIYTPVESFEPGILAAPILATNLVLLGIGILYYKKRSNSLNKILDFEISKKIAQSFTRIFLNFFKPLRI